MPSKKLYIILNSHIDPVWLWNKSSGRASFINTMHSTVKIMHERPELKFSCSAASLYRWIEKCDPRLFADIADLVKEGRWEIIGGWEVQSDCILSRTEPLLRQAESAKTYFMDKFDKDVRIAYNVDAFGHSAGLPKILRSSGITHYVFNRSQDLEHNLFAWTSDDGSQVTGLKVLGYGYSSHITKEDFMQRIQLHWDTDLPHQVVFMGIGDHGGGLSRKHLDWLEEARQEYNMVYSTLEEYFAAVEDLDKPEFSGELGPVFAGCYSNCHEVKHKIARATRKILKAERLGVPAAELTAAWRELLFNHFHDILPGTSVRSAYEKNVFPGLGMVEFTAEDEIDEILARKNTDADTSFMSEGGIQIWNPHPFSYKAIVSFDAFTDPNANGVEFDSLRDADGNVMPLQILPPATSFGPCGEPWGRFATVVEVPPLGERYLAYAAVGLAGLPNVGFERQRRFLHAVSFPVFYDNTRTWGFGLTSFADCMGEAKLESCQEYINGPVCSVLRTKYSYRDSSITLDVTAYKDIPELGITIRLDWHEIKCCLKLSFKHNMETFSFHTGQSAHITERMNIRQKMPTSTWDNSGQRQPVPQNSGECAMIDWCAASSPSEVHSFFAPDLHSCDHTADALRVTLLRPVLYADHRPFPQYEESGWMDTGVSWRKLWYFESDHVAIESLPRLADARLMNAETREVTAHAPGTSKAPKLPSLEFDAETTVLGSARETANGKCEITLINYGRKEMLNLNDNKVVVPSYSIKKLTIEQT
jgi:alpha-mannosidase